MYDTVRISSPPISTHLESKLVDTLYPLKLFNMETGEVITPGNFVTLSGEFNNAIWIAVRDTEWIKTVQTPQKPPQKLPSKPYITLDGSVHKALMGHNVFAGPKNIQDSISYLIGEVERVLDVKLPPAMEWTVERVDIAEVFLMDNPDQVEEWFRGMLLASYPRREKNITRYAWGGLYIKGSTTNINIYHKGPQLRHLDNEYRLLKTTDFSNDSAIDPISLADNIIKAEVQIHRRKLHSDYGRIPTVRDLNDSYFEKLWSREMYKLSKEAGRDVSFVRNHEAVRAILQENFSLEKANRLEAFWLRLCTSGEVGTKKFMKSKKSTFHKYRKELIDIGISWTGNDLMFPEYSIVPSEFSLVRGNKYHFDIVIPEVQEKLDSYMIKSESLSVLRCPVVSIKDAAALLGVTKNRVRQLIEKSVSSVSYYPNQEKGQKLIILDSYLRNLVSCC